MLLHPKLCESVLLYYISFLLSMVKLKILSKFLRKTRKGLSMRNGRAEPKGIARKKRANFARLNKVIYRIKFYIF